MDMTESNRPTIGTFPLIAFSIDTVAGLTGLSVGQLQRWDRNGFFQPTLADPNRRRPYSRIYSRDDVVALATIAKLREAGVSLIHLRPLLPFLAPDCKENGEWPARSFYVVGNRVYLSPNEMNAAAEHNGRQREPTIIELRSVIADVAEAIERLRERRPEQIGQVTRNRGIMGGVPIIAGTRIPTATIAWFHRHGCSLTEILEDFPRLTATDVKAAIAFENQREATVPESILAHG